MLDAHADHVEEDEHEDGDLEPPRHGDVVEEGVVGVLRPLDHLLRLLPAELLHGGVVMLLALRQEHLQHASLVLQSIKLSRNLQNMKCVDNI